MQVNSKDMSIALLCTKRMIVGFRTLLLAEITAMFGWRASNYYLHLLRADIKHCYAIVAFCLTTSFSPKALVFLSLSKYWIYWRKTQPERKDINKYAIFGRRSDGSADGRTGSWLEVTGESAEELVHLIKGNIPAMSGARHTTNRRPKSCCWWGYRYWDKIRE